MAHGGGGERWLVTYADLISLLMTLFLLLFSSAEVSKEKLMAISDALRRAIHKDAVKGSNVGAALLSRPVTQKEFTAATEAIQEAARALGIDKGISFSTNERGILISIVDTLFFGSGMIEITSANTRLFLKEVALFCKDTGGRIVVEGHTDNHEINKGIIRSNWELSMLRAASVIRFLIQNGVEPTLISGSGFADTKPLLPNISASNRARNRRIDIVLINQEMYFKSQNPKDGRPLSQLDVIMREHKMKEDAVQAEQDRLLGVTTDTKKK